MKIPLDNEHSMFAAFMKILLDNEHSIVHKENCWYVLMFLIIYDHLAANIECSLFRGIFIKAANIECSLFRGVFMCDQRNFHVKRKQK
jgi:hypothetical protein